MSPEQARGKKVDRRADIWAFGVVLWEMLIGHKLFEGETVSDVLAAVLTREPDLSELPPDTPARVRRVLGRCLQRDPRRRIRDMGDVRGEIYIQSFPEPGVRIQVTRNGGGAPLWAANSELFYWNGDRLFAVPVGTTPELTIGEPEALFTVSRFTTDTSREYDVTADGRRIIIAKIPEASRPREVQVVLNWFTELERLAGPGGAQ